VAGSALFQTDDPEQATRQLRTAATAGLPSTPPVGR
jgi:hypothetical protein